MFYVYDSLIWLLILIAWNLLNKEIYFKQLVRVLLACVLINILYALFTVITEFNIFGTPMYLLLYPNGDTNKLLVDGAVSGRIGEIYETQSIFSHKLTLGQTLILVVPFFVYFKKYITSFLLILITGLILIVIFLSGARSSIVPAVFGYILFLLFFVKKRYVFFLFIVLLVASFSRFENKNWNNMISLIMSWDEKKQSEIEGSSVEMRLNQVQAISDKWQLSNPLTGCGRGYREYQQETEGKDARLLGYESILLLIPVEQGIIGFVAYSLLIILLFYLFYRKQPRKGKIIVCALFILFVSSVILTGSRRYSFLLLAVFGELMHKDLMLNKRKI
jgi:O-antigen ligase